MRLWFFAMVALTSAFPETLYGQVVAPGQTVAPEQAQVRFTFDRPVAGVMVPHYMILIKADGTGEYRAEVKAAQSPDTQAVEKLLTFSGAAVKSTMELVHLLRSSDAPCASRQKNVADTGSKVLAYRDAEGEATCTFNYSENKGATKLTEFFQGVEMTLEAGRALDYKHRFDRLGLDAEMISLGAAVESGRAVELGTIASTLRSIAGDTELIQRVRLRAAKLLEQAQTGG